MLLLLLDLGLPQQRNQFNWGKTRERSTFDLGSWWIRVYNVDLLIFILLSSYLLPFRLFLKVYVGNVRLNRLRIDDQNVTLWTCLILAIWNWFWSTFLLVEVNIRYMFFWSFGFKQQSISLSGLSISVDLYFFSAFHFTEVDIRQMWFGLLRV